MDSAYKLNKQGDNIQPWHTPFPIWNQSVVPCPVLTVASWPTYRFLRRQVMWSGIPISWRIFHSLLWSTQSKPFDFFFLNLTILYWFCQISKWIHHRYTRVPHPEPSSLLPPHTIPLGRPSALAPSIQYRASNLDWQLVSYMIFYMFQCYSPKSSHPLPQSPKDCSIHQCLFCCLVHRVIVTIFLNSIYMR